MLKETDFHTGFTKHFKTTGDREILERNTIQRRLLLSLFGLGTNTGLKAVFAGSNTDSYQELRYIRNKFIHKDHLRKANAEITNHIICNRRSMGRSYPFRWHPRYRRHGVMIYWHTDRKSACIYSQLKSCLSSKFEA